MALYGLGFDGAEDKNRETQGGEEEAEDLGCDPEDVPATGPVHGRAPTALQAGAGEEDGDRGEVGVAGGDRGGEANGQVEGPSLARWGSAGQNPATGVQRCGRNG